MNRKELETKRVFIISDTHFNHRAVLRFERGEFKTIKEHDEYIIKKWNSVVKDDDIVFHLGDLGLGSRNEIEEIVKRLNGHKILIRGNHDNFNDEFYLKIGFEEVYRNPVYIGKIVLSHFPLYEALNNPYIINVHGHLHSSTLSLDNYSCVSCKKINYTPVLINNFKKRVQKLKSRKERFLDEWYAKYYVFDDKNREDIVYDSDGKINIEESKRLLGRTK